MIHQLVMQRLRGAAPAPFAAGVLLLAAALLVAAFSVWNNRLQAQESESLRARSVAYEIDRALTDAMLLQQAFLTTGDTEYFERSGASLAQLNSAMNQAQAGAALSSGALQGWLQSASEARGALEAARLDAGADWRGVKVFDAYQENRSRWSGEIDAELAAVRSRAVAISHKLDVTVVGLIGAALLLTVLQAQEIYARLHDEAAKHSDAVTRNERLNEDLAASQRKLMEVDERFDLALAAAGIIVFSQDHELRYQWVSSAGFGRTPEEFVGATDEEIFGPMAAARSELAKREAMQSRKLVRCEIKTIDRGAPRWIEMYLTPRLSRDGEMGVLGAAIDITERHLDRESNSWLMRELSHRTQNLLAIVQSMARHTARNANNGKVFISRFRDRLAALSAVHHLLVKSSFRGVDMDELVRSQLLEAESLLGERVHLSGPAVILRPNAAQNLAMGLSELASNALTHGALKSAAGTVDVTWSLEQGEGSPHLRIRWIEHAQGALEAPRPGGFGSVIVTRMLPRSLGAKVTLEHLSDGTVCDIVTPLSVVAAVEESAV